MDSGKDSVDLLKRLLDRFGTGLRYVIVRNQIRGNDFSVLENSGEQARALALGAKIVSIKRLHDGVIQKIDAGSSSFWKAKTSDKDSSGLGLMDRQRVKMWLRGRLPGVGRSRHLTARRRPARRYARARPGPARTVARPGRAFQMRAAD
jgi:hypothetical protein